MLLPTCRGRVWHDTSHLLYFPKSVGKRHNNAMQQGVFPHARQVLNTSPGPLPPEPNQSVVGMPKTVNMLHLPLKPTNTFNSQGLHVYNCVTLKFVWLTD